jgi:hypothetical protein
MRTNYAAVVVCAIVYWLLGGLWFDWLFGKPWMQHMSTAQASSANPAWIWPFILTFLLNLVIAFALARVCIWRNAHTAARGAATGLLLWVGIVARLFTPPTPSKCGPSNYSRSTNCMPSSGCALWGAFSVRGRKSLSSAQARDQTRIDARFALRLDRDIQFHRATGNRECHRRGPLLVRRGRS